MNDRPQMMHYHKCIDSGSMRGRQLKDGCGTNLNRGACVIHGKETLRNISMTNNVNSLWKYMHSLVVDNIIYE